ncbi:MAG TPA: KTSC domain-containing protein [Caulobacterales bacterium]|nr:KTSC domain-containing protein [Caulobacterales bacterium]
MRSSALQRYLYDAEKSELVVTFPSGKSYAYEDVPLAVYEALCAADSKGAFFNAHIRDEYYMRELK